MGTTAYGGKGSEWRSASRRRQLQTRTIHQGYMPTPPPPLHVMVTQVTHVTQVPLILVHEPLRGSPVARHSPPPPLKLLCCEPAVHSRTGIYVSRCCVWRSP